MRTQGTNLRHVSFLRVDLSDFGVENVFSSGQSTGQLTAQETSTDDNDIFDFAGQVVQPNEVLHSSVQGDLVLKLRVILKYLQILRFATWKLEVESC